MQVPFLGSDALASPVWRVDRLGNLTPAQMPRTEVLADARSNSGDILTGASRTNEQIILRPDPSLMWRRFHAFFVADDFSNYTAGVVVTFNQSNRPVHEFKWTLQEPTLAAGMAGGYAYTAGIPSFSVTRTEVAIAGTIDRVAIPAAVPNGLLFRTYGEPVSGTRYYYVVTTTPLELVLQCDRVSWKFTKDSGGTMSDQGFVFFGMAVQSQNLPF